MAKFEDNKGGSVTVKLDQEVEFEDVTHGRATIPALKGKHIAAIPFEFNTSPSIGEAATWASRIVEPVGIYDTLDAQDALDVAIKVLAQLGKRQPTGESPSP